MDVRNHRGQQRLPRKPQPSSRWRLGTNPERHAERSRKLARRAREANRAEGLRALEATFFVRARAWEEMDKHAARERVCGQLRAGSGSAPCSASKARLTRAKTSSARSSVGRSCVAITLVRSSAPPGG